MIVIVFGIILVIVPLIMQRMLAHYLTEFGAQVVTIGDVDFNIFTGELSIKSAQYEVADHNPFNCDAMSINLDIFPVFSNRIFVHDARLKDCDIQLIRHDDNSMVLNGLKITPTQTSPENTDNVSQTQVTEPWQFGIYRLLLSNVSFNYNDSKLNTAVNIEDLSINDVVQWTPDMVSDFMIKLTVNDAPVTITGTAQPFSEKRSLNAKLAITKFDFQSFSSLFDPETFVVNKGLLTTQLDISSELNSDKKYDIKTEGLVENQMFEAGIAKDILTYDSITWKGKLQVLLDSLDFTKSIFTDNEFKVSTLNVSAADTALSATINNLSFTGKASTEDVPNSTAEININGASAISGLTVVNKETTLIIAIIESMGMQQFKLINQELINIPSFSIKNALLLGKDTESIENKKAKTDYLLSIADLSFEDIQIKDLQEMMLASVKLNNINTQLVKEKDGKLKYIEELSQLFSSKTINTTSDSNGEISSEAIITKTDTNTNTKFIIKVGVIDIQGNNSLQFKDYSAEPYFQINLHNMLLTMKTLDNSKPETGTTITFHTDIDESGKLDLNGESKLFSPKLTTKLSGKLANFELHPLTSYTLPTSGRKIRHGLLSSDIDIAINNRKMNNKFKMFIKNLTLIKEDDKLAKKYDATLPMPVEMAIDFLEDKQGVIKLNVPVQGDLDNPDFQLMPAILAAIRKTLQFAALSYMKYALQPWGSMIAVGEILHGQISKISFEPIEFNPGKSEINKKQLQYLDKLAGLMKKTPRLDLTVCGIATARDKKPSSPGTSIAPKEKNQNKETSSLSQKELLPLASRRADAVKHYLIEQKKISPKRIHNCNPIYRDDPNIVPAVELVL